MPPSASKLNNVLVVSHYYAAHGGGIERVAAKLIREIGYSSLFHFVWAASDTEVCEKSEVLTPLPMFTFNFTEKFLGIPCPLWGPNSFFRLKKAVKNADIIWLHDTLYLGNIMAYYWARKFKKPIVITQHIGFIPYKNFFLRTLMRLMEKIATCRMLKNAAQTTFVSDRVAQYFYQKVSFSHSIQIIPNGVDSRIFHPPMEEKRAWLRQQFALRIDQPVMLFAGRFVEKKGLAALRLLAQKLPNWRFWLAGNGPMKPEGWRLPNIHVFHDREEASLAELYQAADLLLLPSFGEGFPLVIQEAMASGLPVFCSRETAAGSNLASPHLVQIDVDPHHPKITAMKWASVLESVASQLPRKSPDRNIAEFAAASWSWTAIAGAYADIFQNILRTK